MKYFLIICLLLAGFSNADAQEQTAKLLQETARTLVQKGDYDNAVLILERAAKQEPDNVDLLRDLCFANYLKRDFSKAIEVGKEMVEKPNADQQSFQVLGMAYKAIASYKECGKLYRTALRKFPNSGVIYNEYGELNAMDNELDEAINQWEKGIEVDPGYSSNYYNATMYHTRKNNPLRAALYGELFLNLESYSTRTEEIKSQLYNVYSKLVTPGTIAQLNKNTTLSAFEKTVLEVFGKALGTAKTTTATADDLVAIRTRFILEWAQGKQKTFPFRLFDHQQYLLNQGLFEAYTYWLFGPAAGEPAYQAWQTKHPKETEGFKTFQQSRVFKIPTGEYYFSK
ncbi:MAG: tetratricopeptide repeat protein [Bacteroidota bacterium]